MKLPGTSPPKVQNKYSTPSANRLTTSCTSSFTMTLVGCVLLIGGGTSGAWVRTAFSSPIIEGSMPFALGPRDLTASSLATDNAHDMSRSAMADAAAARDFFVFIVPL